MQVYCRLWSESRKSLARSIYPRGRLCSACRNCAPLVILTTSPWIKRWRKQRRLLEASSDYHASSHCDSRLDIWHIIHLTINFDPRDCRRRMTRGVPSIIAIMNAVITCQHIKRSSIALFEYCRLHLAKPRFWTRTLWEWWFNRRHEWIAWKPKQSKPGYIYAYHEPGNSQASVHKPNCTERSRTNVSVCYGLY